MEIIYPMLFCFLLVLMFLLIIKIVFVMKCFNSRLYDWQTMLRKDVRDIIKGQAANTQLEFEQRANDVILQFAEQVCISLKNVLLIIYLFENRKKDFLICPCYLKPHFTSLP